MIIILNIIVIININKLHNKILNKNNNLKYYTIKSNSNVDHQLRRNRRPLSNNQEDPDSL